jgi:hypothetical protein
MADETYDPQTIACARPLGPGAGQVEQTWLHLTARKG